MYYFYLCPLTGEWKIKENDDSTWSLIHGGQCLGVQQDAWRLCKLAVGLARSQVVLMQAQHYRDDPDLLKLLVAFAQACADLFGLEKEMYL
ncbi:MAG: hypothetical protein NE330_15030, partial [Lentisphaeraceae bacterium]|nr:hypothetical protein [Lentisphaeraceae bacterium]